MKFFVEELPESCSLCDCCHTKPYDSGLKTDGEKFCGILNEDVEVYYYYSDGRPEFCPLRKIPYKYTDIADMYRVGWNDCVDEMIRE